uniref:Ribosomal protein L32 n=1 Tax=Bistorta vivipara TaxID=371026 RepID=A0A8B0JSG8_9CARY|nr:ribosomal protein L32 [Bistorta vivipara]QTV20496.1 ribosomal protein L32 [Bistorta vivipara]
MIYIYNLNAFFRFFCCMNINSKGNFVEVFLSQIYSYCSKILLLIFRIKKLFELPVEIDFANEKAFNAAEYPFLFQKFLRISFLEIEVRFFGTAILKEIFIVIVGCERHLLFKAKESFFPIFLFSYRL